MNRPRYYAIENVDNGFIVYVGANKYIYESPTEALMFLTEEFRQDYIRIGMAVSSDTPRTNPEELDRINEQR